MADDRFRVQAEAFIAGTIQADNPDITVQGTAVQDLVVRSGGAIAAATTQEIEHLRTSRDISDPEAISPEDMDKNLENLMVPRNEGSRSTGPINLHFSTRRRLTLTAGMRVSTKDNVYVYLLADDLLFNETDFIANPEDGTYYVRASFIAEGASAEYDLDIGLINVIVDNAVGALYCRNPEKFQNGIGAQTNAEYVAMVRRAISTRLPITTDGSTFLLQQLFGLKLLDVLVIGNGDPEMLRDELHRQDSGDLDLVSTGTPTGVHVGGRQDIYHWYRRMNYVETTIDLSVDLQLTAAITAGASSVSATFPAGGTTQNQVPAAGKIVIELGAGAEETLTYSSRTFSALTQTYVFTLTSPTSAVHAQAASVKVAGDGRIAIGPGTKIDILPVLRIQSVTLLDPLSLAPLSTVPRTTPTSARPGWYLEGIDPFTHMSAKETKTLVLDEKLDGIGNAALSGSDAVTDDAGTLSSASVDFTGYEGRVVHVTYPVTGEKVDYLIDEVISPTTVLLVGDVFDGTFVDFEVDGVAGEYSQFAVRVGYYTHVEAQNLQAVLDGGRKRVVTSNSLSRLFYPVFLDFRLRFRGAGTVADARNALLTLVQASQGTSFGVNDGARFEVSDLIAAVYNENVANYVETPFEIKVTTLTPDGETTTRWVSPGPSTVMPMVIADGSPASPSDTEVRATFISTPLALPAEGWLILGAFVNNKERIAYRKVVVDGDEYVFHLAIGGALAYAHGAGEPMQATVSDFAPENVITDGVIVSDKIHRPYFGTVVVEKL